MSCVYMFMALFQIARERFNFKVNPRQTREREWRRLCIILQDNETSLTRKKSLT